jgi:hypothetical protein
MIVCVLCDYVDMQVRTSILFVTCAYLREREDGHIL